MTVSQHRSRIHPPPFDGDPDIVTGKFVSRWAKARKRKLVRRRHLATWLITVPALALVAATILIVIDTFL